MADKGNVLLDCKITNKELAYTGAESLINISNRMLDQAESFLRDIRNVVKKYGKADLVAALGVSAATEMDNLYNRITTFIKTTASEIVVPPMED